MSFLWGDSCYTKQELNNLFLVDVTLKHVEIPLYKGSRNFSFSSFTYLSSSFCFCRTSQSSDAMLDRSALPWQDQSLFSPAFLPLATSCWSTLQIHPASLIWQVLDVHSETPWELLLDLLWVKPQESEVTHFTSAVQHGFSLENWMTALAYGSTIPSYGALQSAVCGYLRLELGAGYLLHPLGCMSCHILSIVNRRK